MYRVKRTIQFFPSSLLDRDPLSSLTLDDLLGLKPVANAPSFSAAYAGQDIETGSHLSQGVK
jgi:hypothetical protein